MRIFRAAAAIAGLGTLLAVVSAGAGSVPTRMQTTPAYVLTYCARSKVLMQACPHLLPRMSQPPPQWQVILCLHGQPGCNGLSWDDLSLIDAGNGTRPPIWSHIEIYAGDLRRAFPFYYPSVGRAPAAIDGLFAHPRGQAVFLGRHTWGGKAGTLVLAPSFPRGGEQGDHVIFWWRQGATSYAVGLHAWEPLSQAVAVLRVMIRSL